MQIYKMTDCFTDKNELNLVSGGSIRHHLPTTLASQLDRLSHLVVLGH